MMKKILIIDDDTETLDLLTRILKKHFDVLTISDTEKLSIPFTDYTPDLIIVDHFIGCKTSKEIIGGLRKQEALQHVPVIIHSGHEQIEDITASSAADGYIRKPSGIGEIRACIENYLNWSGAEPAVSTGNAVK